MNLSRNILDTINKKSAEVPDISYFDLPEKVLQFGTGALLRALPDYFIDKANKQGIFNGRIVLVKSTSIGSIDSFSLQDNLYTQCVRGIINGKQENRNIINASISRVLSAKEQWDEILASASNPDLQLVVSNTTEVGIELSDDSVFDSPPNSFPGKLLAFLYQRYKLYHGDNNKGLVIIPTELIPDNGDRLQAIILELAHRNSLETNFIDWLENTNQYCNSLVDRIVPGKTGLSQQSEIEKELNYHDELMIMSEAYRLWAIETSDEKVKNILSFAQVDEGIKIIPDISIFREMKLRILNGAHTFGCALAYFSGFYTVKDAMANQIFSLFMTRLMTEEIAPSIITQKITHEAANEFISSTLDRFRNPYIEHQWLSISMQYTSKMALRNVPTIINYYSRFKTIPPCMSLGFAAFILFMRPISVSGKYYGKYKEENYLINDVYSEYFSKAWENGSENIAARIVSNADLWGTDLAALPGFTDSVQKNLNFLLFHGTQNINNHSGMI